MSILRFLFVGTWGKNGENPLSRNPLRIEYRYVI